MTVTFFAALVVLAGLFTTPSSAVAWTLVWSLFGAGAAAIFTALGGNPLTPAMASLPFLAWAAWRAGAAQPIAPAAAGAAMPPAFWLALCIGWGLLTAFFLPRLFAGDEFVYVSQRASTGRPIVLMSRLQPVSGNLTQPAYALAGLLVFACAGRLARLAGGMAGMRRAMAVLGSLLALCIVLNLGETYLGLNTGLSLVRNGGYAVMVGGDQGGLQRITGTFSEASAFAAYTLPVFAFVFALWMHGDRARWVGLLALGLLGALLLATSSTGYVALALYLAGVGALRARQAVHADSRRLWRVALVLGVLGVVVLGALVIFKAGASARLEGFYDKVLGQKLHSHSGEERMRWNLQGLKNLVDTGGLGVGLGSTRASSYIVMLLSNLGLVGTTLYAIFVWNVYRVSAPGDAGQPEARRIRRAFRHAFAAALCAAAVSASVFDRGLAFYVYAALAAVPLAAARAPSARRAAWPGCRPTEAMSA